MPAYEDSPDLQAVGLELIKKFHPDLKSINIGYLFRDKASYSHGRLTLGMAVRVDDRNYVYGGRDVMIEIGKDTWDQLSTDERQIVLDHELHHIQVELDEKGSTVLDKNGRPKVFLKRHDVEEFYSILERYGDKHKALTKTVEGMIRAIEAAAAKSKPAKAGATP